MSESIIAHMFQGYEVEQRIADGFINATAMCVSVEKDLSHWIRLETTFDLVSSLAEDLCIKPRTTNPGTSIYTRVSASFPTLVITKKGSPVNGGGTWIHPDLAIQLAQWLSPKFALAVSKWIRTWLNQKSEMTTSEVVLWNAQRIVDLERAEKIRDAKVKVLETQVESLKDRTAGNEAEIGRFRDSSGEYYSVIAYAKVLGIQLSLQDAIKFGKQASRMCRLNDIIPQQVRDPRFGLINTYPEDILNQMHWYG